jgi:hypothetical protein
MYYYPVRRWDVCPKKFVNQNFRIDRGIPEPLDTLQLSQNCPKITMFLVIFKENMPAGCFLMFRQQDGCPLALGHTFKISSGKKRKL